MEINEKLLSLWQDLEGNLSSGELNLDAFIKRIKSLPGEEQKEFFDLLTKKEFAEKSRFFTDLWGRDEEVDLNLVKSLGAWPSAQAVEILQNLATRTGNKQLAKAIRRALFRLQSKGLKIPEPVNPEPPIFSPPKLAPAQGYLSACDAEGNRLILISRPQIPKGVIILETFINDEEGIIDFAAKEFTKKESNEYIAELRDKIDLPLIASDPTYCLGIISEAIEAGRQKGKNPPSEFIQLLPYLGSPPPLPLEPIIYKYLSEEEINTRPDLLDRAPTLFEIFPFNTWFLEEEKVQKFYELYKQALDSSLVLTPQQKEGRLEDIFRLAAQEIFHQQQRKIYRRRLEEMAYILWKEEKDYEARICLSAALALEKESGLLTPHPFLRELVKRSLERLAFLEKEREEEGKQSLIIKP